MYYYIIISHLDEINFNLKHAKQIAYTSNGAF